MKVWLVSLAALLVLYGCAQPAREPGAKTAATAVQVREGAIVRGPTDRKRVALVFTGHEFAEGGTVILDALAKQRSKASFFFTGVFLENTNFSPLIRRIVRERHYLGPHSDRHLLYCPWEGPKTTLVTKAQFKADLQANLGKIARFGVSRQKIRYFLPPYEHYNEEIASWTREMRMQLVNYTPGTRSNADYTGESERNFVCTATIYESILAREGQDSNGLNGFLLLLHIGAGPGRADKFHLRFPKLLERLHAKGYSFVSVNELLEGANMR